MSAMMPASTTDGSRITEASVEDAHRVVGPLGCPRHVDIERADEHVTGPRRSLLAAPRSSRLATVRERIGFDLGPGDEVRTSQFGGQVAVRRQQPPDAGDPPA